MNVKTIFFTGFKTVVISLVSLLLQTSCSDPGEFTVGQEFIDSQTNVVKSDTFSVELSTVLLDSFPTSGNSVLWVGKYSDTEVGEISSAGFFKIGLPGVTNIQSEDVYDSVSLVLYYNNKSFGDTTQYMRLSVHQLTEAIQLNDDDNLYNSSSFGYNETELGKIVFLPRPNSEDSVVEIPLKDELGLEFFNGLSDNLELFTTLDQFTDYFKGLAIVPENENSALVGFEAAVNDAAIRVYSHRNAETVEEITHDFPLIESEKQFNRITSSFINTRIQNITTQKESVPSSETEDICYLCGGTGLVTKINFPFLEDILLLENNYILKADFVIYAGSAGFTYESLPSDLYLYQADNINRFGDVLYDGQGYAINPTLYIDELYHENTFYTFDITNYIKSELVDSYVDESKGIIITLDTEDMYSSFEKVLFPATDPKSRLVIYYLTYQ